MASLVRRRFNSFLFQSRADLFKNWLVGTGAAEWSLLHGTTAAESRLPKAGRTVLPLSLVGQHDSLSSMEDISRQAWCPESEHHHREIFVQTAVFQGAGLMRRNRSNSLGTVEPRISSAAFHSISSESSRLQTKYHHHSFSTSAPQTSSNQPSSDPDMASSESSPSTSGSSWIGRMKGMLGLGKKSEEKEEEEVFTLESEFRALFVSLTNLLG
jgi:hypothetical protein